MARILNSNIEQYRPSGSSNSSKSKRNYLTLKDNGSIARGRILCAKAEDIECFEVHRVKVGDYEREVNCLYDKESGGSLDDCPFCKAGIKKTAKIFIPFFNKDAEPGKEIQIFERPYGYYSKISNYCARYNPIIGTEVEIERRGEAGYQKTDYDIFPVGDRDGTTVEDILDDCGVDALPKILGSYVLDKSAEDMEYFVAHNEFPPYAGQDEVPTRRRATSDDEPPRRRASSARGGDRF